MKGGIILTHSKSKFAVHGSEKLHYSFVMDYSIIANKRLIVELKTHLKFS
jgi:hypothetical protein